MIDISAYIPIIVSNLTFSEYIFWFIFPNLFLHLSSSKLSFPHYNYQSKAKKYKLSYILVKAIYIYYIFYLLYIYYIYIYFNLSYIFHSFFLSVIMALPQVVKSKHNLWEMENTEYNPGSITQQFCDLEQLFYSFWELCFYFVKSKFSKRMVCWEN